MMVLLRAAPAVLESGVYRAVHEGLERTDTDFGFRLKWRFIVEAGPHRVRRIAWSGLPAGPRSKARRWAIAIAGRDIEEREFDEEELTGRECRVVVSVAQREDGSRFNTVHDVLPLADPQPPEPDLKPEHFVLNPADEPDDSVLF